MVQRLAGGGRSVDQDGGNAGNVTVDGDHGHLGRRGQQGFVGEPGCGHDDSVSALAQLLHSAGFHLVGFLRVHQQLGVPGRFELELGAPDEVEVERVGDIRDQHPHRASASGT